MASILEFQGILEKPLNFGKGPEKVLSWSPGKMSREVVIVLESLKNVNIFVCILFWSQITYILSCQPAMYTELLFEILSLFCEGNDLYLTYTMH